MQLGVHEGNTQGMPVGKDTGSQAGEKSGQQLKMPTGWGEERTAAQVPPLSFTPVNPGRNHCPCFADEGLRFREAKGPGGLPVL